MSLQKQRSPPLLREDPRRRRRSPPQPPSTDPLTSGFDLQACEQWTEGRACLRGLSWVSCWDHVAGVEGAVRGGGAAAGLRRDQGPGSRGAQQQRTARGHHLTKSLCAAGRCLRDCDSPRQPREEAVHPGSSVSNRSQRLGPSSASPSLGDEGPFLHPSRPPVRPRGLTPRLLASGKSKFSSPWESSGGRRWGGRPLLPRAFPQVGRGPLS